MPYEPVAPPVDHRWHLLRDAAKAAASTGYAPYSQLHVGAAARCADGSTVTGANVENASYGLTLCAECGIVSEAARRGTRLVAVVCCTDTGALLAPCGRCRQLLAEHAAPGCTVLLDGGPVTVDELLPHAFVADDIDTHRHRGHGAPR